ncbi:MAG TPA: SNF2-related protein [Pseudomonadota bacterium]|nr:SNF2-related protein [Pseudomonadota bacterium]
MTPAEVLGPIEDELAQNAGERAATIRAWFAANRTLLLLASDRLSRRPARDLVSVVEDEITGSAPEAARPTIGRWFRDNRMLLQLVAERLAAAAKPVPTAEVQEADEPELWSAAQRTAANLAAIRVLTSASAVGKDERAILRRYSGWGGLSLDKAAGQIPAELVPDIQALAHEYYTPLSVTREAARLVAPLLADLGRVGTLLGLEPSAGIGRFLAAFPAVKWVAVEYAKLSAAILAKLYPEAEVTNAPFESWAVSQGSAWAGRFSLVASNPPYGRRGAFEKIDPDPQYKESQAYLYFLRRGLDLLAPRGIGIYLIPYGFLTGRGDRYAAQRERVLKRHHLLSAFRLPSELFPGGNIVTDLLFFQARGGEVASIVDEDRAIVAGDYYRDYPTHILGTVVGSEEDEGTKKARRGYEISGRFEGLPDPDFRPLCRTCAVVPFLRAEPLKKGRSLADLPEWLQTAHSLGERVERYLGALSGQSETAQRLAASLHSELAEALLAFQRFHQADTGERTPIALDPKLNAAAKQYPGLVSFLSAWNKDGTLAKAFVSVPRYAPKYHGSPDDVPGMATFLFETERYLTIPRLLELRASLGKDRLVAPEAMAADLLSAGFAQDGESWMPESVYYTGDLWPKYDRAKARAESGDDVARRQAARLLEVIGLPSYPEIAPEPRAGFLPAPLLREWLRDFTGVRVIDEFERQGGLLRPVGKSLQAIFNYSPRLKWALGYLNHDMSLFAPEYEKRFIADEKREESASEALDRTRLAFHAEAVKHFGEWMSTRPDLQQEVEEAYGRTVRGWIQPTFPAKDLELARWTGPIRLKPHQLSGAWRLVMQNGGLLGFDVGVGKTLTGIAAIARLRQTDRARRVMVVVPNSIVWKWRKEFQRALPDYRVGVIGSERYVGRDGVLKSRTDTPQERALKYRRFQGGEFDCVLVTFSAFGRNSLRKETAGRFITASPVVQRSLGLKARNELKRRVDAAKPGRRPKKQKDTVKLATIEQVRRLLGSDALENASPARVEELRAEAGIRLDRQKQLREEQLSAVLAQLQTMPERERAVFELRAQEWIADVTEAPDADPGVVWEDLGVDLIVVDEAQNYKNLWPAEEREGGIPKYLGAISEGSQRAWDLALRAFEIRERNGGGGVILLSATPAKNSPLEYFGLIGMVAQDAWTRIGINDPEGFIDRFLVLEIRNVVQSDLRVKTQSVVAGFRHLNELRDVLFRFAEFKTAEEVGLKLPETDKVQVKVTMEEGQLAIFRDLVNRYRMSLLLAGDDPAKRFAALGLLQRMALCSIHPELPEGAPAEPAPAPAAVELQTASEADSASPDEKSEGEAPESSPKDHRIPWTWRNASRAKNYSSPKLDAAVRLVLERPGCGHILFSDNIAVHFWLRELLVKAGIPKERIGVLNGEVTPAALARQEIAERFNGVPPIVNDRGQIEQEGVEPELDVVLANATAYEGIDLQVRTCQVIHLDLPWEPATLQQRNGRAVRQGNMQAVVRVVYIVSADSNDQVRLDMIQGKLGWMRDVLSSADRETNNPAAEQELTPEELLLLGSEDPEAGRQALDEVKRQREAEAERQTVQKAWETLATLARRIARVPTMRDPEAQTAENAAIQREIQELERIPAALWPWHFLLEAVRSRRRLAVDAESRVAAIEESLLTRLSADDTMEAGLEVGKVQGAEVAVRRHGTLEWTQIPVGALRGPTPDGGTWLAGGPAPSDYDLAQSQAGKVPILDRHWSWRQNPESDHSLVAAKLSALLGEGPVFIGALKWQGASRTFRSSTWNSVADLAKAAVAKADFRPNPPAVPTRSSDGELVVALPGSLGGNELMPWTEESFQEFVPMARRAMGTLGPNGVDLGWAELNQLALNWWQRPLPKARPTQQAEEDSTIES